MSAYTYEGDFTVPANPIADRYASPEMVRLFSDEQRVYAERQLWVDVMEGQAACGVPIPKEDIDDYRAVMGVVDLASMREREKVTKHDVNARLEEFNALARHEHAMKGMTSRDVTENVEQWQVLGGMQLMSERMIATLARFASRALEYQLLPMAGRSHNVAAEPITLGKRFANFGEELLHSYAALQALRGSYPLRGFKGPVGTQQGLLGLFEGDAAKVEMFETSMRDNLGFTNLSNSVGQVYPRSLDHSVVSRLLDASAGPANFATTLRLMAGQELATEGFEPGQVGSNAMPHKMNAAKSERIGSLYVTLLGFAAMAGVVAGHQWNEGDVSCSAARRVYLPSSFFAAEGIQLTTMKVLDGFGAYPAIMNRELERYLPFMLMARALMIANQRDSDRQVLHARLKQHSVAVALEMRETGQVENDLFDRIDADPDIPVTKTELREAMDRPLDLTGLADQQVTTFIERVDALTRSNQAAASYTPPRGV